MYYHTLLLWARIMVCQFQVLVVPKSYPPPPTGTQMFQLRQRVLRKVDTSIAFKGGSNRKVVTEDYTRRMCLKKIRSIYPVNGFDTPELTMGDLYEMLL
jgi:hypothetical protein